MDFFRLRFLFIASATEPLKVHRHIRPALASQFRHAGSASSRRGKSQAALSSLDVALDA